MNRLVKEASVVEDLNGVRCAVVEKNVSPERTEFLKKLLEHNGYTVMVAPTPPPPVKKPVASSQPQAPSNSPEGGELSNAPLPLGGERGGLPPSTFTVGVTTIAFHAMLSIYERSLITPEGNIVSIAYWNQEPENKTELYWMRRRK